MSCTYMKFSSAITSHIHTLYILNAGLGVILVSNSSWSQFFSKICISKLFSALKLLCPPNEVVKELDRLKDEVLTEDVLTLKKIRKLFSKPEFRVGLFLVCFLQIAQQLSGINIVGIIIIFINGTYIYLHIIGNIFLEGK